VTIAPWILVLVALAGVLLGFLVARLRSRRLRAALRAFLAPSEPEPAPAPPPPRRKCEIRRYVFADGSEYVAHTLGCDGHEASEDAARAHAPAGAELLEVVGGETHELD